MLSLIIQAIYVHHSFRWYEGQSGVIWNVFLIWKQNNLKNEQAVQLNYSLCYVFQRHLNVFKNIIWINGNNHRIKFKAEIFQEPNPSPTCEVDVSVVFEIQDKRVSLQPHQNPHLPRSLRASSTRFHPYLQLCFFYLYYIFIKLSCRLTAVFCLETVNQMVFTR